MDSDQDDVFEFCLDQIESESEMNDGSFNYPALPARPLPSPDFLDDHAFEQFDDATTPIEEPLSIGSISGASPNKLFRAAPRSEALAATLNLDGNKLRAMQSAFDQESTQYSEAHRQPQWLNELPGLPDAPKSPMQLMLSLQSEINDDEWGGPAFSQPKRAHRSDVLPRSACEPIYDVDRLNLIGPKSSMFRSGFGPGLRFACRGSSLTSVRILRIHHSGVNPRLIDLHQKAVDRGDPLEDLAQVYQECPGDHWALLIALFDPNFSSCHIHMRNALSNWLESAMASNSQQLSSSEIRHHIITKCQPIQGSDFWSKIASTLLGHRLSDAVTIALQNGNMKLATLISENGSGLRGQSRQLLREQIKKWMLSGTWQTFTETCQAVYRVLAGDVIDEGSDWLANFSAKFWFSDRQNESIESLLCSLPSSTYDIRKSLLELRSNPSAPTVRLFKGNPKHFDYSLMWHMYDILSRRGIALYGDSAWNLRLCYIAQLEAAKQLKSALYLIIIGCEQNPKATVTVLQEFLTRNWPKSGQSGLVRVQFGLPELFQVPVLSHHEPRDFFLPEEVDIIEFVTFWTSRVQAQNVYDPMKLIYIAKYCRCLSDGNISSAMTCALRAGLWDSAFSIFITEIAPHLILTRDFEICQRLLSQFSPKMAHFPQSWSCSGQALLQILGSLAAESQPEETFIEKGFLSDIKFGPRSPASLENLHLLENAIQRLVQTHTAQKARLTALL